MIAQTKDWALGNDNLQWILYRKQRRQEHDPRPSWHAVSFVSSTREVLERCMREKGVSPAEAIEMVRDLPDTFEQWKLLCLVSKGQERVF